MLSVDHVLIHKHNVADHALYNCEIDGHHKGVSDSSEHVDESNHKQQSQETECYEHVCQENFMVAAKVRIPSLNE